MTIEIRKAARKKAHLRIGASGPSGSGKTYSMILVAKGILGGRLDKMTIIDTENGSADLYSHLGDYNVISLSAPYTPEKYIEAIEACEKAGMELVMIDSVSHEWDGKGGLLEANELIAQTKFKGNTWAAWSVTTPRHQRFLQAITASKMHMITTARSKTDTIQTEDKKIKKVGLKEIQREGFEYELTVNFTLDRDGHYAIASKDRTGIFSEQDPFVITEGTGQVLRQWAETATEGAPVIVNQKQIDEDKEKTQQQIIAGKKGQIIAKLRMLNEDTKTLESCTIAVQKLTQLALAQENYDEIIGRLTVLVDEAKESAKDKAPGGAGAMSETGSAGAGGKVEDTHVAETAKI